MDPRFCGSTDPTTGTKCEQMPFELPCGRISAVLMKNVNEAGGVTALLVEPQQRGRLDLFNQEILVSEQGLLTSEAIRKRGERRRIDRSLGGQAFSPVWTRRLRVQQSRVTAVGVYRVRIGRTQRGIM